MKWCSERQREVLHVVRMEERGDPCENGKHRGQCVHSPRLFQVKVWNMCGMRTAGRGFQRDFPDCSLGICILEKMSDCRPSFRYPCHNDHCPM